MKYSRNILIGICIILLIVCNGWLIYRLNIPDIDVRIGTVSDTGSMDFTNSYSLAKDDVHTVLLSLIQASPAEQEQAMETAVDAVFSISQRGSEQGVYVYVWKTAAGVIVSSDINNASTYKRIPSGSTADIQALLEKR